GAEWWILRSTAGLFAASFGQSTDKAAAGDYTGDGKADVAFWRPSTGEWYVLRSEDSSFFAFPFGTSGDVAAPGDFDGDGKTDAAVFRPSNSTWFVNKSTGGVQITPFGTTGDVPVPSLAVR
ncbi:MAG: FG-GAP repeat domain-containing protein, partial [Pyrinomonadaceae bacterium]